MILLDYNIAEDQAEQLRCWRVHFRQIGREIGRPEWQDQEELLRFLHQAKEATFFTRDLGFFQARFCHPNYCIVVMAGPVLLTASLIRQFLRHPEFKSKAKRKGKVVKLTSSTITWWEFHRNRQQWLSWRPVP
jgi:hypothetical protein